MEPVYEKPLLLAVRGLMAQQGLHSGLRRLFLQVRLWAGVMMCVNRGFTLCFHLCSRISRTGLLW